MLFPQATPISFSNPSKLYFNSGFDPKMPAIYITFSINSIIFVDFDELLLYHSLFQLSGVFHFQHCMYICTYVYIRIF